MWLRLPVSQPQAGEEGHVPHSQETGSLGVVGMTGSFSVGFPWPPPTPYQ